MPTAQEILHGLAEITNRAIPVSIGWHIVLGVAVIAVVVGVRPPRRLAASLLSAPLASVGVLAFAFGNPFNGAVFSSLAVVVLAALALRAPAGAVSLGRGWAVVLGCLLIAFSWVYPHFLEGRPAFAYLYAAPVGLIPCPTLSLVVGAALVAGGFALKVWRLILAAAACFYALFGAARLGVAIDVILFAGVVGLFAQYMQDRGVDEDQ